jgi:hypothetical protein
MHVDGVGGGRETSGRLRSDLSSSLAFQDAAPRQFKKQCPKVTVVQSLFWDVEIHRCFLEYFPQRYGKMCQRGKLKKGGVPRECYNWRGTHGIHQFT